MGAGYAAVYDLGPTLSQLRAYGPPEVVTLDDLAGNGTAVHEASGYWELVSAVSVALTTDNSVADRVARLSFAAGDPDPFAQVAAAYAVTASHASRLTFALGTTWTGAQNAPSIVTPLPPFLLLPGWTLTLDVLAGVAGDALSAGRVYRQRYVPVTLERYGDE